MTSNNLEEKIDLSKRNFLKGTAKAGGSLLLLKLAQCKTNESVVGGSGSAQPKPVAYDGVTPLTEATIRTDMGTYSVGEVAQWINNPMGTIMAAGYITREAKLSSRDFIMVPTSEEGFYSDVNVAQKGTHKFAGDVKVYIDGPTGTDYTNVKDRFSVVAGASYAHSYVGSEGEANFVVRLDQDTTNHGEVVENGIISKTTVKLEPGAANREIDEEIAQGLLHVGNSTYGIPTTGSSCIAGDGQGWNEKVDRPIMNAFKNRDYSKFQGNGMETEK